MIQTDSRCPGFEDLDSWLVWLESLSPKEIELGLDRVLQVLARLQLRRPARVVHVAGTNGKGSCATMLEALFMARGERVGTYTSPHLERYNERIRLQGSPVTDATIVSAFERVEAARGDTRLTYFEFGTLAALAAFESGAADTVILEVGMGGRLDAVNAVEPDAGIITNVSLDHCDWLGEDIESIAAEKAGVLRPDKPFVFGAREVPKAVLSAAEGIGVDLRCLSVDFDFETRPDGKWNWSGRRHRLESLSRPGLAGDFQLQNAAAVLALVEAMQLGELLDVTAISEALNNLELEGRCQMFRGERTWLLDVAHNAEAASALSEFLGGMSRDGDSIAVIGALDDKDVDGIVSPLCEHVDAWIAVEAEAARAIPAAALASRIAATTDKPCLIEDRLPEAMQYARARTDGRDLILVTGSFYTVGPALQWLKRARPR